MFQGVKEFIATYRDPFNKAVEATKKAKERLREAGLTVNKVNVDKEVALVLAEWEQKAKWGTAAHETIQKRGVAKYPDAIVEGHKKKKKGKDPEEFLDPKKILDINSLKPGKRYYEKQIIDPQNGLIGFIDELYVDKKWNIHIIEYKTTKNLNRLYTFMTPKGPMYKYYHEPVSDLIDCNFVNANLQASFYMYMLWYYNKKLKPGKIIIKHIKLNEDTGKIETMIDHDAPYLLTEVKKLIKNKKK